MFTWWSHIEAFDVSHVSGHGLFQVTMDYMSAVEVAPTQHNCREEYYHPPTHGDDKTYNCQRKDRETCVNKWKSGAVVLLTFAMATELSWGLESSSQWPKNNTTNTMYNLLERCIINSKTVDDCSHAVFTNMQKDVIVVKLGLGKFSVLSVRRPTSTRRNSLILLIFGC